MFSRPWLVNDVSSRRKPGSTGEPTEWLTSGSRLSPGRQSLFGLLALGLWLLLPASVHAALQETPMFVTLVDTGALPAVAKRVPELPALAELETIGRPGGELRLLMASPKDTRLMVVYGYARLVAYTPGLALVPDMLEDLTVDGGKSFTL